MKMVQVVRLDSSRSVTKERSYIFVTKEEDLIILTLGKQPSISVKVQATTVSQKLKHVFMINDDFILVGSVLDSEPDSEISLYVTSINCPSQPPPGSFEGCAISIETNCSGSPVTVLCTSRKYWHTCITTSISIASILTVL